jgi:hypothetical protein
MERLAEIRLTKSILLIPEKVIWKYIPIYELEAGIKRGKLYKRIEATEKRNRKGDDDNERLDN